jgi:hypothetical protein
VESQEQAFHPFHEPLGNLAQRRRDSHIPTTPTTKADGKVENQKQVFHFPTAAISFTQKKKTRLARASPSARGGASRASVVPLSSAAVGNFHSALDRRYQGREGSSKSRTSVVSIIVTSGSQPNAKLTDVVMANDRILFSVLREL